MKRITIFALHLGIGGIEKAISSLCNNLCNDYDIEIISTYKLYDKPAFEIDPKVKITYLIESIKPNKKELLNSIKKFKVFDIFKEGYKSLKILYLKKHLMIKAIKNCNSDIGITAREFHNKLLGKYGTNIKLKIGWEHNNRPEDTKFVKAVSNSTLNLDYFIVVSKNLKELYQTKTKTKVLYIPNVIDDIPDEISSLEEHNLISIGRLAPEKGFLDLIDIFNKLSKKYPDWKLNIIGDGSEREAITKKINNYNLDKKVIMHGFQNKKYINKILAKSSIYIMTSYTESFGIVILESFSYGVPVLAFDSALGACELIENSKDGFLIPNRDQNEMINKISELIDDLKLRKTLGYNGYKKSLNFSQEKIKKEWLKILK